MLRFRMTAEWAGLEFLHYHPNTLLSAIDLEAQKHGFALEKLDELRRAMREAEAR